MVEIICIDCNQLKQKECKDRCISCYKKYRHSLKPKIPCECGCGELISNTTKLGIPARFKHGHNTIGENNPAWNGGKRICNNYIIIYKPDHPKSWRNMVYEHRCVYEQYYNCCLL